MASASSRSIDRARGAARPVAWLGLGAVLALGLQRVWTPSEPSAAEPVRAVTRAAESSAARDHSIADVTPREVAEPVPSDAARVEVAAAVAPHEEIAPADDASGDAASVVAVAAPADEDAPTLPLPRMPGSTRLSESARFDAATSTWKLKAAFKVHAHVPHVLAFYRKALADQGLEVDEQGGEDGPQVLVGRSDRVHAQIGIRTKPNELETRVWVLWRVRA